MSAVFNRSLARIRRFSSSEILLVCLLLIVSVRGFTLEFPSLVDPTESRYADVAEEMYTSGNWITPHVWVEGENVPYLGKPPLHFWLTTIVYSVFGLDEWSARMASFLSMLVVCAALGVFSLSFFDRNTALLSMVICASSAMMFFLSGASLIDVTLTAGISCAVVAFALALMGPKKPGAVYAGYAALAMTMLTKGPVGLLLAGVILVPWLLAYRRDVEWKNLRPVAGGLLFLLISAPWYILCEIKNPGFLKYFFLHENFLRFFLKDYGDRYGSGHTFPYGSAWWMAIVSFLPWTPIVLAAGLGLRKQFVRWIRESMPLALAASWAFAPLCFLTFIRQLHVGYIVPALPGLALLTARIITDLPHPFVRKSILTFQVWLRRLAIALLCIALPVLACSIGGTDLWGFVFIPIGLGLVIICAKRFPNETQSSSFAVLALVIAVIFGGALLATDGWISQEKSTSTILRTIASRNPNSTPEVSFLNGKSYSSQFYAAAWAEELVSPVKTEFLSPDDILRKLPENLVIEQKQLQKLSAEIRARYAEVLSEGKWSWLKLKS